MRRGGGGGESYINPCLTMHQPWASLLVHGIKRIEGRSWPAPLRGRLWIHAASKVPDPATIKAMEDFYKEIYAVNGIMDLKFPESYPVSQLLGCIEVVGCIRSEELIRWEELPEAVRLEGLTDFCWLCEKPQRLLVPFEMRGYKGVYNLESQIYEAAIRGLCQIEGPQLVKFPLPDPHDPFSLKPGSLANITGSKMSVIEKTPSLTAAIEGARAAATQFSKKETRYQPNTVQGRHAFDSSSSHHSEDKFTKIDKRSSAMSKWRSNERDPVQNYMEQRNNIKPPSLSASMAGTPAAATEFYKNEAHKNNTFQKRQTFNYLPRQHSFNQENRKAPVTVQWVPQQRGLVHTYKEQSTSVDLPSPTAPIATTRAAGTQFSKMEMHRQKSTVQERRNFDSSQRQHSENKFTKEDRMSTRKPAVTVQQRPQLRDPVYSYQEQNNHGCESNGTSADIDHCQEASERPAVPSKIFAAAVRGLRLT